MAVSTDLDRLIDILWPLDEPGLRVDTAMRAPAGRRAIESYLVFPSAARAAFILPANRDLAVAALREYNGLRARRKRAVRWGLAQAVRLGGQRVMRQRLLVTVPDDYRPPRSLLLRDHLTASLDEQPLELAAGVRRSDPNSKPTAQLYRPDGTPAGFAKVGWNQTTNRQLRVETAALRHVSSRLGSGIRVPEVKSSEPWRDRELCVVTPMPSTVARWPDLATPPPPAVTEAVAATAPIARGSLREDPYLSTLRARSDDPGWSDDVRTAFRLAHERILFRYSDEPLRVGAWHGDWVPWNLATDSGELWVWDWEHYGAAVPIGLDLMNWHFLCGFVVDGAPLAESFRVAGERSRSDITALQGSARAAEACAALYALELTARYESMHAEGSGRPARFYPAIVAFLDGLHTAY